ncbi:hypothetical protein A1OW_21680 [Enterovibrio norvegicus]|uniref:DMT family transporter n=1 Tax=Enterovibrio norvegicus TaxID=188144 RepID=A0ABV4L3C8_9GAMM|nr:DMT family transporter [Enterovibrio norvegicus]OEF58351.1 hypothetical protein A1OU_09185 [Enterovibrio norvegicus]OEF59240.1 hypothetical protein A1OW_21680 [Enterovibrio norvegicus]PMI40135.1 hypothetical protein BCU46_05975 [Enterovibrio norvegicus]
MGVVVMMGAAVGFGLNPLLSQLLLQQGYYPEVVAFFRCGIPMLLALPYLSAMKNNASEYIRSMVIGVCSALGMLAFLASFQWVSPTAVILIYYTYPLFAMLFGWLFFGQALTRNRLIAAFIIGLAVSLMQGSLDASNTPFGYVLLCFVAPASYALVINYLARPILPLQVGERMSATLAGHMLVIIPVTWFSQPTLVIPETFEQSGLILAIGIFAAAIPQYLFVRGTLLLGGERATMISTFEIVFALMFSVVLLGQNLEYVEVVACLLIVTAGLIRFEPEPSVKKAQARTVVG